MCAATIESAYTIIVPRLLVPIILHRRQRQLGFARVALARYLQALNGMHSATGGGGGSILGSSPPTPRGLPPAAAAAPTPVKKSGNILTSLYGRLVGHLEREEEVRIGYERDCE